VMPDTMQAWVDLSPMAWALDGFHTVILRQGGMSDILAPCFKLLLLATVLFAATLWGAHHRRRI
jgi:ABC-2 type transport system permease protein